MAKHEIKFCPRCGARFECKMGSIFLCQCWTVPLTAEERAYVEKKYDDCLCARCLKAMKNQYHQEQFEKKLRSLGDRFK